MSSVLHWTPEQLEAYRSRLGNAGHGSNMLHPHDDAGEGGEPEKPRATRRAQSAPPSDPAATLPDYSGDPSSMPVDGWRGKQTETEKRYNRDVLHGAGRFEAVCLYLPGGGRYTPDFMTVDGGQVTFHEVKGSYRLGSQGRAFTAFHEAAVAFPLWRFVWATWTGREWKRKTVESTAIGRG